MIALVRRVPASYPRCIRSGSEPIDVDGARSQHASYVSALECAVEWLPPLDEHPDSVFVEDTAVILDVSAVLTRPGARARREETASVAAALERHRALHVMRAPATLDGGDVLRVGRRLFVGLSRRTNREGLEELAAVARREDIETIAVPVARGLHLKSGCTLVDEATLLCDRSSLDVTPFTGLRVLDVGEPEGANVLVVGAKVLASTAAPRTIEMLTGEEFAVVPLEMSEIHKGDGALTCLSLRLHSAVNAVSSRAAT